MVKLKHFKEVRTQKVQVHYVIHILNWKSDFVMGHYIMRFDISNPNCLKRLSQLQFELDSIRAWFDMCIRAWFALDLRFPESSVFEACPWFWLAAQLLGAIYVNIVYYSCIYCNYRDFYSQYGKHSWWWWRGLLRSTAAVAVTIITSVCVLNKLNTYCGLLWVITTLLFFLLSHPCSSPHSPLSWFWNFQDHCLCYCWFQAGLCQLSSHRHFCAQYSSPSARSKFLCASCNSLNNQLHLNPKID